MIKTRTEKFGGLFILKNNNQTVGKCFQENFPSSKLVHFDRLKEHWVGTYYIIYSQE